ncbi:hypothetical protein KEM48_002445 [Puccinia striiformis f. sp. tritici PST-130]|nr:hypothetical protein KEM48_002445 [Puccinia striiformis f. sp. tritici PST-130]
MTRSSVGDAYVRHLLSGNERRAQAMFRMSINVFHECSEELEAIDHEPASKLLSMDEQLAIFLYIVGQNATNRQTQDRFQHSGETISKVPETKGVIQSAPLNDAKVVERTFGTWKKRFPILVHPFRIQFEDSAGPSLSAGVLHNMIIEHTCEPTEFVIDPDKDGTNWRG